MRKASIVSLLITLAFPANVAADSPQDECIARVEAGLLPPLLLKGDSRVGMSLQDRMAHYKVPGISIAVLDAGALVWARSWGVVHSGKSNHHRQHNVVPCTDPRATCPKGDSEHSHVTHT